MALVERYRVELYGATLATVAAVAAAAFVASNARFGDGWVILGLAVGAAVAERSSVRLSSNVEQSLSLLPTLFAAVAFGPFAALVVGACSNLGDFRPPYLKWLVYTATRAISGAAAGAAAVAAGAVASGALPSLVAATAAGGIAIVLFDVGFSLATYKVKDRGSSQEILRAAVPVVAPVLPLWMPLVALLAFSYDHISSWTLLLFSVPALAAQRAFVLYQEQRRLSDDLQSANDRLEGANLSFATALVATLDARDRYTAGHSAAVAIYSRDIATRMGLSADEIRTTHLCGLVHDIGKVGLPVGLLEKRGPLTLQERRLMQDHSVIGATILANVDDYSEIARVVKHHHERFDGHGYPDGLVGCAIPLPSRIIAVADAYNAMTSDRPYREAMPSRVARMRLAQAAESQFDTSVVAAFEAILAGADEEYRLGTRSDFAVPANNDDEVVVEEAITLQSRSAV